MAYVVVPAKMARVTYGIIQTGTDYLKQWRQVEEPLLRCRRDRKDFAENVPAFHLVDISL